MTSRFKRVATALTVASLSSLPAHADIKVNENFSFGGYAVGSYQYIDSKGTPTSDSFDLNAAKLNFNAKYDPITTSFGIFYTQTPSGTNNLTLIEAHATYNAGATSITGGRFLSWMGYEAFNAPDRFQVSSAYINPHGTIMFYPAYHEGVKVKYSTPEVTTGFALLDSLNGPTIFRGDGELKHNYGAEGFVAFNPMKELTLWAGIGYDSAGAQTYQKHSTTLYNVWAQYTMGKTTLAAEYLYQDAALGSKGSDGLVLLDYKVTKEFSSAFRISAGKLKDFGRTTGLRFRKYTVCPAWNLNDHFVVRPEISFIHYKNNGPISRETYYALQAIAKF